MPIAAVASESCSVMTPTKATPAWELSPIAAAISSRVEFQSEVADANPTAPPRLRPFEARASTIDALSDRPHASSRTTVTTDFTPASDITCAIKWPCLAVLIAVRNRLSPAIESDSDSDA